MSIVRDDSTAQLKKYQDLSSSLTESNKMLDHLQRIRGELGEQLSKSSTLLKSKDQELSNLKATLSEIQQEVTDLINDKSAEDKAADLEDKLEKSEKQLKSAMTAVNNLTQNIYYLQGKAKEDALQKKALEDVIESLKTAESTEHENRTRENSQNEKEVAQLHEEIRSLKEDIGSFKHLEEKKIAAADAEKDKLAIQIEEYVSLVKNLKAYIVEQENEVKRLSFLKRENEELVLDFKRSSQELEQLQSIKAAKDNLESQLAENMRELKRLNSIEIEKESLQDAISQKDNKLKLLATELDICRNQVLEAEYNIQQYNDRFEELRNLKDTLKEKEEAVENLSKQLLRVETELAKSRDHEKTMTTALQRDIDLLNQRLGELPGPSENRVEVLFSVDLEAFTTLFHVLNFFERRWSQRPGCNHPHWRHQVPFKISKRKRISS